MDLKKISRNLFGTKQNIVVIVQCRLSSTRLPGKALLPLGDKCILEWTLASLGKVKADNFYLAVDTESKEQLEPIAKKNKWKFLAGSKEDVLQRFCDTIELSKADIVVRGTADNPFLFYEAANDLVTEFLERSKAEHIDYITFTGLPHGSGVEIFDAHSLLKAAKETDSPYDHEHVGPALYNHKDKYNCIFAKAPFKYNHPDFRTTVDTAFDYRRAERIFDVLSEIGIKPPYSAEQIVSALELPHIKNQALVMPSCDKGHGTGHLRRGLDLALKNKWDIYIGKDSTLTERSDLIDSALKNGLKFYQIVDDLSNIESYSCIITDMFKTNASFMEKISEKTIVISIDDGSEDLNASEYVLDIIPTAQKNRITNFCNPSFIPLPQNKNKMQDKKRNALIAIGGEDPQNLTIKAAKALAQNEIQTTAIVSTEEKQKAYESSLSETEKKFVRFILPVENLREKLHEYGIVVTHYGFTAFESLSAGCNVITVATTPLHEKLSKNYGFTIMKEKEIKASKIRKFLAESENSSAEKITQNQKDEESTLEGYTKKLSLGSHFTCPVCKSGNWYRNRIVARTKDRTFRRCSECGMTYISWTVKETQTEYNHAYFYEDYKKQYGKTYLDDFESIKMQSTRRIGNIDFIYRMSHRNFRHASSPTILDIGCALGPFLSAASDFGWQVFGTDICQEAVEYVQQELKFPAVVSKFPDADFMKDFGVDKFDAVTMWFVIEHFQNLDEVLRKVSSIIKDGGMFAFSTPSASGISGKFNRQMFFEQSPSDHFSIWEIKRAKKILKKYGFSIKKIVSTGIHPERFPFVKKHNLHKNKFAMGFFRSIFTALKLGDTFEIYCKKDKSY